MQNVVQIDLNCLFIGPEGVGKSSLIAQLSDPVHGYNAQPVATFIHEPLTHQLSQSVHQKLQNIHYRVHFHEKLLKQNQALVTRYELSQHQFILALYDLQESKSFTIVQQAFKMVEDDLRDAMTKTFESENKHQATFIGLGEDEQMAAFLERLVSEKRRKMIILLGNKVDFDYDSARQVTDKQIEQFTDKYEHLNMVQGEVSALLQTNLAQVKRAIQFQCQKFLSDQDLQTIAEVNEAIRQRDGDKPSASQHREQEEPKKSATQRVSVPKFGQKKAPVEPSQTSPRQRLSPDDSSRELSDQGMRKPPVPRTVKNSKYNELKVTPPPQAMQSSQASQFSEDSLASPLKNPQLSTHVGQPNQNDKLAGLLGPQGGQMQASQHPQNQGMQNTGVAVSQHPPMQGSYQPAAQPSQHQPMQASYHPAQQNQPMQASYHPAPQQPLQNSQYPTPQASYHQPMQASQYPAIQASQHQPSSSQHPQASQHPAAQGSYQQPIQASQHPPMQASRMPPQGPQLVSQHMPSQTTPQQSQQPLQHQSSMTSSLHRSSIPSSNTGAPLTKSQVVFIHENTSNRSSMNQSQAHLSMKQSSSQALQLIGQQQPPPMTHIEPSRSAVINNKPPPTHSDEYQEHDFYERPAQTPGFHNSPSKSQRPAQPTQMPQSTVQPQKQPHAMSHSQAPPLVQHPQPSHSAYNPNKSRNDHDPHVEDVHPSNRTGNHGGPQLLTSNIKKSAQPEPRQSAHTQDEVPSEKMIKSGNNRLETTSSRSSHPGNSTVLELGRSKSNNQHSDMLSGGASQHKDASLTGSQYMKFTNKKVFNVKAQQILNKKSDFFGVVEKALQNDQNRKTVIQEERKEDSEHHMPSSEHSQLDDFEKLDMLTGPHHQPPVYHRESSQFHESSHNHENSLYHQHGQPQHERSDFSFDDSNGPQIHHQQSHHYQNEVSSEEEPEQTYHHHVEPQQSIEASEEEPESYIHATQGPKLIYAADHSERSLMQPVNSEGDIKSIADRPIEEETKDDRRQLTEQESDHDQYPIASHVGAVQRDGRSIPVVQTNLPLYPQTARVEQSTQIEFEYLELLPHERYPQSRFPNIEDLFDRHNVPMMHPRVKQNLEPLTLASDRKKQSVSQPSRRQKPVLNLSFDLKQQRVSIQIFEGDTSYSVAYKLLKHLNVQTTSAVIQKLADVIQLHINQYCDKLEAWTSLKKMGPLESAKWKATAFKNPDMLQKIEEEHEPEFSVNFLRDQLIESRFIYRAPQESQVRVVNFDRREKIGLLHVQIENDMKEMDIFRQVDPAEIVDQFLRMNNLSRTEHVYQRLYDEVDRIQTEWELKQSKFKPSLNHSPLRNESARQSSRSKTPPQAQIQLKHFQMTNQDTASINDNTAFTMLFQIGKNKQAKLVARRGDNIVKIVDKFAIQHKLNQDMKLRLREIVVHSYENALNEQRHRHFKNGIII